jgi:hypothetical protein
VNYGSAFGKDSIDAFSSYDIFASKVCQLDDDEDDDFADHDHFHVPAAAGSNEASSSCRSSSYLTATTTNNKAFPIMRNLPGVTSSSISIFHKKTHITAAQRLQIAILMTPSTCPMIFKFEPTNLVYGKICMIRQKRAFVTNGKCSNDVLVTELPIEHHDPLNPHHVLVHEIAFGHNLEESVPPCALWFNVPDEVITECTLSDQLKQNRTMKKIRQKQRMAGATSSRREHVVGGPAPLRNSVLLTAAATIHTDNREGADLPSDDGEQDQIYVHYAAHRAFQMYYFHDSSMHAFMREVMILELDKIRHDDCNKKSSWAIDAHPPSNQTIEKKRQELFVRNFVLQSQLESLKTFLLDSFWWPVNLGREYVSDKTPVPIAETMYIIPPPPAREKDGGDKNCKFEQWNSFLNNIQYVESQQPLDLCTKHNIDLMQRYHLHEHTSREEQQGIPSSPVLGPFEYYHVSPSSQGRDLLQGGVMPMNHLPIFEYILLKAEALEWSPCYKEW